MPDISINGPTLALFISVMTSTLGVVGLLFRLLLASEQRQRERSEKQVDT